MKRLASNAAVVAAALFLLGTIFHGQNHQAAPDEKPGFITRVYVRTIIVPPEMVAIARVYRSRDHEGLKREMEAAGLTDGWYFIDADFDQINGGHSQMGWIKFPHHGEVIYEEAQAVLEALAGRPGKIGLMDFDEAMIRVVPEEFRGLKPMEAVGRLRD